MLCINKRLYCALRAGWAGGTRRTLRPLRALRTLRPLRAGRPLHALRPHGADGALRPGRADGAVRREGRRERGTRTESAETVARNALHARGARTALRRT